MRDQGGVTPIEKRLLVAVPQTFAFEMFTRRMADWWPADSHSVSAAQGKRPSAIVLEPHMGGRIYEVLPDGGQADWGQITVWAPSTHLAFDWHPGHPKARATAVHVTFQVIGADQTEVVLTHGGWDHIADGDQIRPQYVPGWDLVLGRFLALCQG